MAEIAPDKSDRAIVGGTLAPAHSLGCKVIAEGVEMAEQPAQHNIEIISRENERQSPPANMPAGICVLDLERRLRFSNHRYASLFGSTPELLAGKQVDEFLGPRALSDFLPAWEGCLRDGARQGYRRSHRTPDGETSVIDVEIVPDVDGNKVVGTIVLVRDVTEAMRAEPQIREVGETLEFRVEQRTAELQAAMKDLKRSQEALARAEGMAALGALAAGVAHELNTPLGNSVMTASTLADQSKALMQSIEEGGLKRSQLNNFLEQLREGSELLLRNLYRAENLLQSFKQVAVDQTSDKRRCFDLAEVVGDIVETLAPSLKRAPHRIVTDVPAGIVLDSFPGPLGQVLINLINNAYLHGFEGRVEPGTVRIGVEHLPVAGGAGGVLILVEDNGKGIAEADRDRIFEPFFTTRMGKGGTGLGLSIADRIVTGLLGGRLSVDSWPGKGTRFSLHLPLVAPQAAAVIADGRWR